MKCFIAFITCIVLFLFACPLFAQEEKVNYIDELSFLKCVYKSLNYPADAREKSVEGTVLVKLTLDREGYGIDFEILKDPGMGLGEASVQALRGCTSSAKHFIVDDSANKKSSIEIPVTFKLE